MRLPGMLHARSRAPHSGRRDDGKVDGFNGGTPPGVVKVLSKGNYVAVVAKTEWQAIQAAQALKVTWKKPATPSFPNGYDALYEYLAKTPPQNVSTPLKADDIDSGAGFGREDHHRNLSVRLPVARLHDARLLCGRCEGRRRDRVVRWTEALSRAECDRRPAGHPEIEGTRDLLPGRGGLWHQ